MAELTQGLSSNLHAAGTKYHGVGDMVGGAAQIVRTTGVNHLVSNNTSAGLITQASLESLATKMDALTTMLHDYAEAHHGAGYGYQATQDAMSAQANSVAALLM